MEIEKGLKLLLNPFFYNLFKKETRCKVSQLCIAPNVSVLKNENKHYYEKVSIL